MFLLAIRDKLTRDQQLELDQLIANPTFKIVTTTHIQTYWERIATLNPSKDTTHEGLLQFKNEYELIRMQLNAWQEFAMYTNAVIAAQERGDENA